MNKLLKYTLGILTIWICIINTTNATIIEYNQKSITVWAWEKKQIEFNDNITCFRPACSSTNIAKLEYYTDEELTNEIKRWSNQNSLLCYTWIVRVYNKGTAQCWNYIYTWMKTLELM